MNMLQMSSILATDEYKMVGDSYRLTIGEKVIAHV